MNGIIWYGRGGPDELRKQIRQARKNELALVRRLEDNPRVNYRVSPTLWQSVQTDLRVQLYHQLEVQRALCA